MARFFNKLFNVRPTEWPRVLLLFLMLFLTNAGGIWGLTIAYAAFLKQFGVEALPWVLMLSSILSVIAISIYTIFVDRIANDRLQIGLFAVEALGIVIGLAFLQLGRPEISYPLLYLLLITAIAVIGPHQITYINDFYDTQAAKRILPVVAAGYRVGAIVAGLTIPLLTVWLNPGMIVLLWLATHVTVIGLTWLMPHILKEEGAQPGLGDHASPLTARKSARQRSSYIESLREGLRHITESTYLRWIAVGTFLLMVLMGLLEYRSSQLLLDKYGTVEDFADFTGSLTGISNIFVLLILLFGMSRLIAYLGLGNASLLFPACNLIICGGLTLFPGLISAAAAYLDRTALRISLQSPIDGLLYNAVPLRIKGRARAFVGGLVVPIGSLVGGLLLLLPLKTTAWFVSTLIGVLAVAYTISTWFIRRQYGQALIRMLEQEDYSFLLSQEASDLTAADPAMLDRLQKKLAESTSHELTVFMAQLISQVGGARAIPILAQAARTATEARTRASILDVILAADLSGDAVRQLYTDLLADPDGRVRQSAIAGLERLAGPRDTQFLAQMQETVHDPDLDVRVQAISALAHSDDFYQFAPAVQALDQLLVDEDPHRRVRGVRVLGQIVDARAVHNLIKYLSDPADEVRLEAIRAAEALSQDTLPSQVDTTELEMEVIGLLQDPVERVRQTTLNVLRHIGTRRAHEAMVEVLSDPSSQVRSMAVDALAQVGKSIIPVVHPKLDAPDSQLRKMTAVILSRVNPKEFGPIIVGSHITGNLLAIYRNHGLVGTLTPHTTYSGIAVLQSALRERNQHLLDEIFYLLTAIHDPAAVRIIDDSLRSDNPRVRANATEALESLTSPQTASLVASLFDPEMTSDHLLTLSQDTWDMIHPDTPKALQQLVADPNDPWLRAITAYALGEMGATLREREEREREKEKENEKREQEDKDVPSPERPGRRARRSPPADLFGAITEDKPAEDRPTPPPERPGRQARRSPPADLFGAITEDKPAEDRPTSSESHERPTGRQGRRSPPADLLGEIADDGPADDEDTAPAQLPFTRPEIEAMLEIALADPADEVRLAAQAAKRMMAGLRATDVVEKEEIVLSTIERIIFLKEVPFFQQMTIDQLRILATVCEEELFEGNTRIFDEGDPGGVLYVVVSGRVGIEQEKRKGSYARLATMGAHTYFGEMTLFDNSPRSASALALQDTLTLSLSREPLIALARQHPDLSIELIKVLSDRLRQANARITDLTRSRPRELQKFFDKFDE